MRFVGCLAAAWSGQSGACLGDDQGVVYISDTLHTQLRASSGLAKVRSIVNSRPDLLKVGLLPSLSRHTFSEATASRRMVPRCVVLVLPHVLDHALKSPAMRTGDLPRASSAISCIVVLNSLMCTYVAAVESYPFDLRSGVSRPGSPLR